MPNCEAVCGLTLMKSRVISRRSAPVERRQDIGACDRLQGGGETRAGLGARVYARQLGYRAGLVLGCGVDAALTCAGESGVGEQQVTPCEQPKCRLNDTYQKPLENAL